MAVRKNQMHIAEVKEAIVGAEGQESLVRASGREQECEGAEPASNDCDLYSWLASFEGVVYQERQMLSDMLLAL